MEEELVAQQEEEWIRMNTTKRPIITWEIDIGILNNMGVMGEVFKVLAIAASIPFLLVVGLWAADGFPQIIDIGDAKYFIILIIVTLVLTALVIILTGNKYSIRYELGPQGVKFISLPKQQIKNKNIAKLLMFFGAAKGSHTSVGVGMIASARQNMYTDWRKVRKIIYQKRRRTIALKCSDMTKNILFCSQENADEVFNAVSYYCSKARIIIK